MRLAAVALSVAILVTYATAGRALSGGPVDGQVLEYDTGKPIEGAMVVARWEGEIFAIVESRSVCVHAEMAVTDKDGLFHIPAWTKPTIVDTRDADLSAYKPGYEETLSPWHYSGVDGRWVVFPTGRPQEILYVFPDKASAVAATHPENVYMKPFVGSARERMNYISYRGFGGISCHGAGASRRNLYPVYRAVYQEAKSLAASEQDLKLLEGMRRAAKGAWLALPADATPDYEAVPDYIKRDLE